MRMRTQRILAALLSLVLLLALAPAGWAAEITACTVKVDLSANNYNGDIYKAQVMADLYLVVPAKYNASYDSYDLDFDRFNTELSDLKSDFQKTIYGEAYGTPEYTYDPEYRPDYVSLMNDTVIPYILDTQKTFTIAASGQTAGEESTNFTIEGLAPGMYILVPHGKDLTAKKDYVATVTEKATEEGKPDVTRYASVAHSDTKEYLFTPQLIFVPTKDAVDDIIATYNPGEWKDELTVSLKSQQRDRFGKLKITKTLDDYIDLSEDEAYNEPVTFVFEITGTMTTTKDGVSTEAVVYKNTAGIEFKAAGEESIELDRIPVGAKVTVKEVYSGSHYTPVGATSVGDLVISAEEVQEASFENKHSGRNGGHGIINEIEYNDEGEWVSEQTTSGDEVNVE